MKNRIHHIFIALSLGIVLLYSCSDSHKAIADGEKIDITLLPSVVADNIHTLMSDSGKLTYRLEAPTLAIYDQVDTPYWDFPEGLLITTFDKNGEEDGYIKSKVAIYHVEKRLWELRKEVRATSPDKKRIETELLYWDQNKEEIYTDEYLEVHEDENQMITKGYGFKSDQRFENWDFYNFEIDYYDE